MMMAYFLIVSTTVSEFVAAMDRMHVTKKTSGNMAKISFMVSIIGEAEGTNMIEDTVRHKNIFVRGSK